MENTTGAGTWQVLQFGASTSVGAGLISGEESPSLYNGYQISGSPGAQFDDMSAELYPYPASPPSTYTPSPPTPRNTANTAEHDGWRRFR